MRYNGVIERKRTLLAPILFLLLAAGLSAQGLVPFDAVTFRFADKAEASRLINAEDLYRQNLSPSDRSYKMGRAEPVSPEEYNAFMGEQTLDWTDEETARILSMTGRIRGLFAPMGSVQFPDEIVFIKTTGLDEGEAACCRGMNVISLSVQFLAMPDSELENTIIHELYHIVTRNNPELREELFAMVKFLPTGELALPPEIGDYRITNPDAVENNHFFMGTLKGKPQAWMPILLVNRPYSPETGGPFFNYLGLYFIAVVPGEGESQIFQIEGKPVIVGLRNVPEYLKNLGRNSEYIIHPEEALADNFVLLVTGRTEGIRSPEIIAGMREILFGDGEKMP